MKNDLKDSVVKTIISGANVLRDVGGDIAKMTNYKNSVEGQIIDWFDFYHVENGDIEGVKVLEVSVPKKVPLKEILDVFPNTDIKAILENVVGKIMIDLEKTEENLRFSGGFQDPIIKSIIKQLSKITKETKKKVEIKWHT